jgi:hypothetical protein
MGIGHDNAQGLARMEEGCMPIATVAADADLKEQRYIWGPWGRGKRQGVMLRRHSVIGVASGWTA